MIEPDENVLLRKVVISAAKLRELLKPFMTNAKYPERASLMINGNRIQDEDKVSVTFEVNQ